MGSDKLHTINPDQLFVEFRDGVTETEPLNKRKYTLTHSDLTADIFLTIGLEYAYDKVSDLRDEVLAEWRADHDYSFLFVYIFLGQNKKSDYAKRNAIFRRELPLAFEAIRYGDQVFFDTYPFLYHAPIWVYFDSQSPDYKRFEYWGTILDLQPQ